MPYLIEFKLVIPYNKNDKVSLYAKLVYLIFLTFEMSITLLFSNEFYIFERLCRKNSENSLKRQVFVILFE